MLNIDRIHRIIVVMWNGYVLVVELLFEMRYSLHDWASWKDNWVSLSWYLGLLVHLACISKPFFAALSNNLSLITYHVFIRFWNWILSGWFKLILRLIIMEITGILLHLHFALLVLFGGLSLLLVRRVVVVASLARQLLSGCEGLVELADDACLVGGSVWDIHASVQSWWIVLQKHFPATLVEVVVRHVLRHVVFSLGLELLRALMWIQLIISLLTIWAPVVSMCELSKLCQLRLTQLSVVHQLLLHIFMLLRSGLLVSYHLLVLISHDNLTSTSIVIWLLYGSLLLLVHHLLLLVLDWIWNVVLILLLTFDVKFAWRYLIIIWTKCIQLTWVIINPSIHTLVQSAWLLFMGLLSRKRLSQWHVLMIADILCHIRIVLVLVQNKLLIFVLHI